MLKLGMFKFQRVIILFLCIGCCLFTAYAVNAQAALWHKDGDDIFWAARDVEMADWQKLPYVGDSLWTELPVPDGIAWLRSDLIYVSENLKDGPIAVYVSGGATFELYWNGELLGANGTPGVTSETEKRGVSESRFYLPPEKIRGDGNTVAIRYSAHAYKDVPLIPLALLGRIGAYQDERYELLASLVPAQLLIGAIGAAALFFGVLYVRLPSDRGSLWLTCMFLLVAIQLGAEVSKALLSDLFYLEAVRFAVIFIASYASVLFLFLFVTHYLELKRFRKYAMFACHAVILVYAILDFGLDKLSYVFSVTFILASLLAAIYKSIKRDRRAWPLVIALGLFALSLTAGYRTYVDQYYYVTMAFLAGTLFILQANAYRRTNEAMQMVKVRLDQLELALLKQQIQPHFIMNTLTALSEWILTSPKDSVEMIDALAGEFRALSSYSGQKVIPLETEIELCRSHLKIMSYRHDQIFELEADLEQPDIMVPPAIFHTLLENALSHSRYHGPRTVFSIEQIRDENGMLSFTLLAPLGEKPQMGPKGKDSNGIGLSYVRARLDEAWGERTTMESGPTHTGYWRTHIMVDEAVVDICEV